MATMQAYVVLIGAYMDGRLSLDEFRQLYLPLFKAQSPLPEELFAVLNDLFSAAEAYVPPERRSTHRYWTTEQEVRRAADVAYDALTAQEDEKRRLYPSD